MKIDYTGFKNSICQASIFTPDLIFSARKILTEFYPQVADLFDEEPFLLPTVEGVPIEIPRITFQSQSKIWRCEIAASRVNFFWNKISEEIEISKEDFFNKAINLLGLYCKILNPHVGRIAAVLGRFARHPAPGPFLAQHFCKPEHIQGALNRTENFELHAHKRYIFKNKFNVNSWARNKTGSIKSEPIILFEQDINTLQEEITTSLFNVDDIKEFFSSVVSEFDVILKLYYPEVKGD